MAVRKTVARCAPERWGIFTLRRRSSLASSPHLLRSCAMPPRPPTSSSAADAPACLVQSASSHDIAWMPFDCSAQLSALVRRCDCDTRPEILCRSCDAGYGPKHVSLGGSYPASHAGAPHCRAAAADGPALYAGGAADPGRALSIERWVSAASDGANTPLVSLDPAAAGESGWSTTWRRVHSPPCSHEDVVKLNGARVSMHTKEPLAARNDRQDTLCIVLWCTVPLLPNSSRAGRGTKALSPPPCLQATTCPGGKHSGHSWRGLAQRLALLPGWRIRDAAAVGAPGRGLCRARTGARQRPGAQPGAGRAPLRHRRANRRLGDRGAATHTA